MSANLSINFYDLEEYLVDTYQDCIMGYSGIHYILKFPNGYGASIIKTFGSYGYEKDLWEMAILIFETTDLGPGPYEIAHNTSIIKNDCVLGNLSDDEVIEYLRKVKEIKD